VQRTLERMIKNLSKTVEDLHRQYGKNSQEKSTFKELLDKLETSIESKKIAVGVTAYLNVITNEMDRLFTEAQETFDCLQKDE
jgi:septation ring formation regulator EzrA